MKRKNLTLSALFCVLMSAEGWTGFHVCQADGTCVLRAYESYGSTCCGHLCISEAALYGGAAITLRVCRLSGPADADPARFLRRSAA